MTASSVRLTEVVKPVPLASPSGARAFAAEADIAPHSPAASLEMTETNLLFGLLIIALDAPAQLGELDQTSQRHVLRKC